MFSLCQQSQDLSNNVLMRPLEFILQSDKEQKYKFFMGQTQINQVQLSFFLCGIYYKSP